MIEKHQTGLCEGCREEESVEHIIMTCKQWCSLRDTQVYAVYPLGKVKDLRIPT